MAKIKLACKSCGKEKELEEKPAPKNNREAKQIYFNCPCGASNLRDGTANVSAEKKVKMIKVRAVPVKTVEKPKITGSGEPVKSGSGEPVKEPKRSEINVSEEENSPVIIE